MGGPLRIREETNGGNNFAESVADDMDLISCRAQVSMGVSVWVKNFNKLK